MDRGCSYTGAAPQTALKRTWVVSSSLGGRLIIAPTPYIDSYCVYRGTQEPEEKSIYSLQP